MANRRNRIIYASQSVLAEGRVLYRIQTLGSSTTFNITDLFELGQLNLTDVVDDSPEVAVTLEGMDYGSIYTMATLAKVPTSNLNHNIRQSDGLTYFGTISGSVEVGTGDLDEIPALLDADSTGVANLVIRDDAGAAIRYVHGVQLIDFGRECGVTKGVDIWSPIQAECALGTANNDIEFTKFLPSVFVNSIEFTYNSDDDSSENYNGETEQKVWLLNSARFVSWEEWHVGSLAGQIVPASMDAKAELILALDTGTVATMEDSGLGFLKKDETGLPSVLFQFASTGGLTVGESKLIPVFKSTDCIPSNVLEYFIYDSAANQLDVYANGLADTLDAFLPAGRAGFAAGDKVFMAYAADEYAKETSKPVGADSTIVTAKYFAPIGTEDVEDVGGIRQGQIEAYLVDPDLILSASLAGATIGAAAVTFSGAVSSSIDLTNFIGLPVAITDGPGKGGPAREIISASNSLSGDYNDGTVTLGGSAWSSIALTENPSELSTVSGVYVSNLCGIDSDYVGSAITVTVTGSPEAKTITAVDVDSGLIELDTNLSAAPDDGGAVLVSTEPTVASTIRLGEYELALRLQSATISADLAREQLKELGHLNPYARPLTLPIEFTVALETTAGDLETFAKFAGKGSRFKSGTLTDIDLSDLLAKDNMSLVVMIYQQTDQEAGGNGRNRKVLSSDMFGDEYFVDGQREIYEATDGSLREYPLKTIVVQDLRPTDEDYNLSQGDNATQSLSYRGTNSIAAVRGFLDVDYVTKTIESQGE